MLEKIIAIAVMGAMLVSGIGVTRTTKFIDPMSGTQKVRTQTMSDEYWAELEYNSQTNDWENR